MGRCYIDLSQSEMYYLIQELLKINYSNDYDTEIIKLQSSLTTSKRLKIDPWNWCVDYSMLYTVYEALYTKLKLCDELLEKIENSLKKVYGKKDI